LPLPLEPFSFERLDIYGSTKRYELSATAMLDVHALWEGTTSSSPAATRQSLVSSVLSTIKAHYANAGPLSSDRRFEAALLDWLARQPPLGDAFVNTDPVLLAWDAMTWSNLNVAAQVFSTDLTDAELSGLTGFTRSGSAILPRPVAEAACASLDMSAKVLELVGTVFASLEEGEAALALWDLSTWDAPMRSLQHAREVARAL
jgi:hypothetical protein